jgi:hypothetical protein
MHAQFNPGLSAAEMAKPWTVAATLRGFYDDNYSTAPNDNPALPKKGEYGYELSPQASFNYTPEQTSLNVNYVYDLKKYFDARGTADQSHIFNVNVNHTISEAYNMHAGESFIYSQDPQIYSGVELPADFTRSALDNIHNDASIGGSAELSKTLTLKASYDNNLYAYRQLYSPIAGSPSLSALLDRMDQLASLVLDWQMMGDLHGLLGYQYEHVGYTSPQVIIYGPPNIYSNARNSDSHFFFIGADEKFTDQLSGSIRAGAQYIEYDNAPTHVNSTDPYVDASLTWLYMAGSSLTVGAKHQHNATDVVGPVGANGNPVLDDEATAGYVNLTQTIAGALTGSLLAQWQHSEFDGGYIDGKSEDFMIFGLNLNYRFNPYFSAEAGYNWNKLVSEVPNADLDRDYTRNQVYLGVKGEY